MICRTLNRSLKAGLCITTCLLVVGMAYGEDRLVTHTKDSLETVKQKLKNKEAVLLDVRSQEEWDRGHLEGAILFPLLELEEGLTDEAIRKKLPEKKILYTYCARGARALAVQELLKERGWDVRALKAGYAELVQSDFEKAKQDGTETMMGEE